MNHQFFNMPRKYEKTDYDEVVRKIKKRYSSGDLVAIFDWGSPRHPGISDCDVLLVWRSFPKPLPFTKRSFALLDGGSRYVLRHPFMHISDEDFQWMKYVYPDANLRKVYGGSLKMLPMNKEERSVIRKAVLNDIVVRHYPRDFMQQLVEGKINVRDSLLRLNSLKYTFSTLGDLGVKKEKRWAEFEKDVEMLRNDWFEKPDKEGVVQAMEEAVEIMMDIISKGRSLVPLQAKGKRESVYRGIKNSTEFSKDWTKRSAKRLMTDTFRKTGRWVSVLPMEYASLLAYYASQEGPISAYVRRHLESDLAVENGHSALKKRIEVLNNQAELARSLRHSDFPAFFDFGYRNTAGINNAVIRIADRLRF